MEHRPRVGILLEDQLLPGLDVSAGDSEEFAAEVVLQIAVSFRAVWFFGVVGIGEEVFGDIFGRNELFLLIIEVEQERQFGTIDCAFLDNPPQFLIADDGSSHFADDIILAVAGFSHKTAITLIALRLLYNLQVKRIAGVGDKQLRVLLVSLPDLCLVSLLLCSNGLHLLRVALHDDVLYSNESNHCNLSAVMGGSCRVGVRITWL